MLSFDILRLANLERLPQFRNRYGRLAHSKPDGSDWSDAQWLQAVVGELGEYANLRKKVDRGDLSMTEARADLARELADVVIYLDILASRLSVDLGEAVRLKFNEVSRRIGLPLAIRPDNTISREARGFEKPSADRRSDSTKG